MNEIVRQVAEDNGYKIAEIELIRNTAAKGCDDFELAQLLIVSKRTGLDPMLKQIYMIKRYDRNSNREVATPQTSIDGYRATADRTNRYAPGREPVYQYTNDGQLWSATAYVKKLVAGTWHEVPATAIYGEYVQLTKAGKPYQQWEKMPHVMLGKCAESLALRKAFPAELSGIYTHEEMQQASLAEDEPTVIVESPVEAPKTQQGLSVVGNVPETPYAPNEPLPDPRYEKWENIESLGKQLFGDEWVAQRNQMVKAIARSARSWKDLGLDQMGKIWQELEEISKQATTPDMA